MGQPVVHFEIGCRDKAAHGSLLRPLFGWSITEAGPASMIDTGAGAESTATSPRSGTSRTITPTSTSQVDDIPAYLAKAGSLGGKTLVPPVTIPTGTFAWFADPDGNTVGLWTPKG